jgi:hypothetical protein
MRDLSNRQVTEGAMLDTTYTSLAAGYAAPEQRRRPPRKIRLDCDLYCPHSVRASGGNAECDHDFESAPTAKGADFAVWNCTKCGRAFKYETWEAGAPMATTQSTRLLR